jgi:magnesium-transporting ATPase (P-type)
MYYFVPISPAKHLTIFVQRVGDKTPADLLIFSANDLKVDNSSLTGESEAQERGPNHKGSDQRPVEADNLVRLTFLARPCDSTEIIGFQLNSCRER